jgi:hypothetical protein
LPPSQGLAWQASGSGQHPTINDIPIKPIIYINLTDARKILHMEIAVLPDQA